MPWRLARQAEPPKGALKQSSSDGGEPAREGGKQQQEARSVQCECCGMAEECTPTYIGRVREHFHGKWVCGLCSEAIKERQKREPVLTVGDAVEAHSALCERFNSTVRLNPKLSLASSMRDIARKSCQRRASSMRDIARKSCQRRATTALQFASACGGAGPKMSCTTSCALPYV